MLPNYEVWSNLVEASIGKGTPEWQTLDNAYKTYSTDPSAPGHREELIRALNSFDDKKRNKLGEVVTKRDSKGALTSLRKYLAQEKPILPDDELAAIQEMGWAQRNALFRSLQNARIAYKHGSKKDMAKEVAENANAFVSDVQAIPGVQSAAPAVKTSAEATRASTLWQDILRTITGIGEDLQGEALNALTRAIGAQTMNALSGAVPILGTVKDGIKILQNLKQIVDNEVTKNRIHTSRVYTRPGDIQVAIDSIQGILSGRRIDLGMELASSVTTFTTSVTTFGIGGPIASAALSGAKLVYTIYNFVNDHIIMTRINKSLNDILWSRKLLVETINEFPFLGAYLITCTETSTLLEFNALEIGNPFFMVLIQYYKTQCDTIISTAQQIVLQSRFEIVSIQRQDAALMEARHRFNDTLKDRLAEAFEARQRVQDLAAHKEKMSNVFQEMNSRQQLKDRQAHQQKFSPVMEELKEQATMLEMMLLMNNEIEIETARLIDIRAMKEMREQQLAKLKLLQKNVQNVLNTYRDQTSGFRSLITRQSDQSTTAISVLTPLATSITNDDLQKLDNIVRYLLMKPGAPPPPADKQLTPLKQPSRLFDLLNKAYGSA